MTEEEFKLRVPDDALRNAFSFLQGGEVVVTVGADGKVTLAPRMTVDDGAKAFWDAVMAMNPFRAAIAAEREKAALVAEDAWNCASDVGNMKAHAQGIAAAIRGNRL